MTKADLALRIARKTGQKTADIVATLDSLFEVVKSTTAKGETIYLRGFGNFERKHRAAHKARNIKKNIEIHMEASDYPSFKPCKEFVEKVKNAGRNR